MIMVYNRVVTFYENGIVEVVDYSKNIEVGSVRQPKENIITNSRVKLGRVKGKTKNFNEDNVFKNCCRAKKKIRQLCNNNAHLLTKFLTLTFADQSITEDKIKLANSFYSKFIKRLEYYFNQKIEYLTVPELTKQGVIHYHMLCNIPYIDIDLLQDIWGFGKVYISRIENINNVGAYVSSYVDKDFGKALPGVRHFFKSKGVIYPTVKKIDSTKDCNLYNYDNLIYTSHNSNFYCGDVYTKIYDKNQKWS